MNTVVCIDLKKIINMRSVDWAKAKHVAKVAKQHTFQGKCNSVAEVEVMYNIWCIANYPMNP